MAIVLGRHWGYITPAYMEEKMTVGEVTDYLHWVSKEESKWCVRLTRPRVEGDISRMGKVIRRNGR